MKKFLKVLAAASLLVIPAVVSVSGSAAYADGTSCNGSDPIQANSTDNVKTDSIKRECDPAVTGGSCSDFNNLQNCDLIKNYINPGIALVSALVGVVGVGFIIYGGIEYGSSGGDPQKAAAGKKHITNAILSLVMFLFLLAFLNFLIPGGVF